MTVLWPLQMSSSWQPGSSVWGQVAVWGLLDVGGGGDAMAGQGDPPNFS